MFKEPQTLIVVYKDELVLNQLKKLVETNDDTADGRIIGTEDGSVKIIPWTEKVWLDNKKAGDIDSKVLFIGEIKGVNKLEPVIDVKYNKWGIKYGWAGKQAMIRVDINTVSKEDYQDFLKNFNNTSLPQKTKKEHKPIAKVLIKGLGYTLPVVGPGMITHDILKDISEKSQQLLLYGILHLYENNLEEFMKS